jgi:Uma2 family endonuclease
MLVKMADRTEGWAPHPLLDHEGPLTVYDLDRMPDDGRRYELVDGMLFVSAAPVWLHQRPVIELVFLLRQARPSGFEVLAAPFAVEFNQSTRFEPDIVVTETRHFNHRGLFKPPLLAVEVLSESTKMYDQNTKFRTYEREGTQSFWLVEPSARPAEARLEAWRLDRAGRYEQIADVTGEDVFEATLPFPVAVCPADLVRES